KAWQPPCAGTANADDPRRIAGDPAAKPHRRHSFLSKIGKAGNSFVTSSLFPTPVCPVLVATCTPFKCKARAAESLASPWEHHDDWEAPCRDDPLRARGRAIRVGRQSRHSHRRKGGQGGE